MLLLLLGCDIAYSASSGPAVARATILPELAAYKSKRADVG